MRSGRVVAAMAALAAAAACAPAAQAAGRCGDHPWCDTSLSPDTRAGLVLEQMTRDEKFELMAGDDADSVFTGPHTGIANGVPRLGIPHVYYTDGPAGIRQRRSTALPAPIGLAATFDLAMAARYGTVVGDEARKKGNDVVHAPTVNIMRTPLAGRTFEAYGEDPFLTARTAVAYIRAMQAQGVVGNVKHYAANNQETDRFTVNAEVSERALREIYLPHFEASVTEADVGTVMSAYNSVNGQPSSENRHLLLEVLKGDWRFDGYVLTDYGFAQKSTDRSANNGLDLEMPFRGWYSPNALTIAVTTGAVSMETIDEHVRRILRTMFRFGMFDREDYPDDDSLIDFQANGRVTREVEEAGTVLLKNEGALPLDASRLDSIAVIGADADRYVHGGGSSNVMPQYFVTPREGITNRAGPGVEVRYDDGGNSGRAANVARSSDVAVVFASDSQSEFVDKPCLSLTCGNPGRPNQDALISEVAAANPNTIVVLETGGPVLMPWVDRVAAVLEAWYPGAEGGNAIAAILFGDADPGGRLPVTFPRNEGDTPTAGDPEKYPGVGENARYKEGVFVGYRHYDERRIDPLFPFGHGLSYTRFDYGRLRIRPSRDGAAVTARVRNTGRRAGVEAPQLYVAFPDVSGAVQQPPRWLKGFAKVALAPGEARTVRFELDRRAFSYWDTPRNAWVAEPGCYGIEVGRSSRDIRLRGVLAREVPRCLGVARRGCLPRRVRLGAPGAPLRPRQRRSRAFALAGVPERRGRRVARWCVEGGGEVVATFSKRRRVRLVATTARGHRVRRLRPGRRAARFHRAYRRERRVARGVWAAAPRSRLVVGIRRRRISFLAVADRPLARRPARLRRELRRAGLR